MIKLLIKKKVDGEVIKTVIDFDGDYSNGFVKQWDDEIMLSWKPILEFDGWEPIEKLGVSV